MLRPRSPSRVRIASRSTILRRLSRRSSLWRHSHPSYSTRHPTHFHALSILLITNNKMKTKLNYQHSWSYSHDRSSIPYHWTLQTNGHWEHVAVPTNNSMNLNTRPNQVEESYNRVEIGSSEFFIRHVRNDFAIDHSVLIVRIDRLQVQSEQLEILRVDHLSVAMLASIKWMSLVDYASLPEWNDLLDGYDWLVWTDFNDYRTSVTSDCERIRRILANVHGPHSIQVIVQRCLQLVRLRMP